MFLQIRDLYHSFGDKKILNNINLEITAGQIVSVVGSSGSGKSTLLRAILGTHPATSGEIRLDGELILKPTRHIGIVYQHYSLYDFLTVRENVAIGLKLDRTSLPYRFFAYFSWRKLNLEYLKEADEFLERVHLEDAIHSYPAALSGGMKQRAAIAQAMVLKPRLLLMDEPFGALDEATRESLQLMVLGFYRSNLLALEQGKEPPYTILIVTHELEEALYVSNRIVGLSKFYEDGDEGATIVYDKATPVLLPDDSKDHELLVEQREEIRHAVFDPEIVRARDDQYVSFWRDIKELEIKNS